jgi:endonuclease III
MPRPRTPKGRARETVARLKEAYPGTAKELCALDHHNAFELLTATILSAQTTDVRVNMVTPALFARYPTPEDLAAANPSEVEDVIRSTGFYQNKTKSIMGMAQGVAERFGGEVPSALEDLVTLAGVGRKTANVVRSVWFDEPGLHARDAVVAPPRPHPGDRPGEDRVRPERHGARCGAWWSQPPAHPPWPACL